MRPNFFIEDYMDKEKDKLFLKYCRENNYEYLDQISETDLILFAVKYKVGRQKYKELQQYVELIKKEAYAGNVPVSGVNIEPFEYKIRFDEKDSLLLMNLSNRSYNSLLKNKVRTILDLFVMSENDIRQIRSMGTKSFNEVVRARKDYFPASDIVYKAVDMMNERIKDDIIYLLDNEKESYNNKKEDNERILMQYVKESIHTIGLEIARKAYKDSENMKVLINSLKSFSLVSQYSSEIYKAFDLIPSFRHDISIQNYIIALSDGSKEKIIKPIKEDLAKISKVSEVKGLIEELCIEKTKRESLLKLIKYLSYDIYEICTTEINNSFANYSALKMREILFRRFKGETLQVISETYSVTREWVRQLETRAREAVLNNLNMLEFDIFKYIATDIGKEVYTLKELHQYLFESSNNDDESNFICYILTELLSETSYIFDSRAEVLVPKVMMSELELADKTVESLDKLIPKENINKIYEEFKNSNSINGELFWVYFNKKYRLYGEMYCNGRLTLHTVYEYVLKNFYPEGIRLYEDDELSAFRRKIHELFGNIKMPKNNNAISARVMDISVLYDRGVHIHESYVHISNDRIDKICNYIDQNEKDIISYSELFIVFENDLIKNHINNKFTLQGLLKPKLESKYIMGKDYISKKAGWTIDQEIEKFILTNDKVTKRDVFEEFNGMNEIIFATNVKKNGNIIAKDNGTYIHASTLDIKKEDYAIKNIILDQTKKVPVSSRKVINLLYKTKKDFLKRNDINSYSELFDVLRYMFGNEFRFSRPFISRIGSSDVSNLEVARRLLNDYDIISINDITELFKQNHIKYISLKNILMQLNDEFIQINKENMGRFYEDNIDDNVLEFIKNKILRLIEDKGYVSARAITDYADYPNVGYKWNPYLVRSFVEKYLIDEIGIVDVTTAGLHMINTIFVKKEYDGMTHSDFLELVIKRKHSEKPFNNNDEILDWIRSEKLDLKVRTNSLRILK